jgi:hypothetical protein
MNEAFDYIVVINGLDEIPLRTTSKGAKSLMQSFHGELNMEKLLLEAVDSGKPFKNKYISVTALFPNNLTKKAATKKAATKKAATKKAATKKAATKKAATKK